jgi:hypothetical protein
MNAECPSVTQKWPLMRFTLGVRVQTAGKAEDESSDSVESAKGQCILE